MRLRQVLLEVFGSPGPRQPPWDVILGRVLFETSESFSLVSN